MLIYTADVVDKPASVRFSNKGHKFSISLQLESGLKQLFLSPGKSEGFKVAQGSVQALKGH